MCTKRKGLTAVSDMPSSMGAEPPPGGGNSSDKVQQKTPSSTTPEETGGGKDNSPRKMRTFEEIMADEKKNRNTLTMKMTKIVRYEDGNEVRAPSLTLEDVGEFIFDVLKLEIDDCLGMSLTTQRYDTKEINLKPGIDANKYITQVPIEYKGHMISVTQQSVGTIKVTFRNVPMNIPDEEIINLCESYGTPVDNIVHYEQMPRAYRGLKGPNRSVNMRMNPGKQFENFYWVEGPLEEDVGCRITVLHTGQQAQCSHCLRRTNCPAMGNGKACLSLQTPRGKIADYMRYLKESHNYMSLKMQYKLKLEKDFPLLSKDKVMEDGFKHMVEAEENDLEQEDVLDDFATPEIPEENNIKIDPNDFHYDVTSDTITPKNHEAFEKLVKEHPSVHTMKRDSKREIKIANLKKKILDTVKVQERRKRDISCESVRSDCSGWGRSNDSRDKSTDSRGEVRPRSEDEEPNNHAKKRASRQVLKPPKIILSQQ